MQAAPDCDSSALMRGATISATLHILHCADGVHAADIGLCAQTRQRDFERLGGKSAAQHLQPQPQHPEVRREAFGGVFMYPLIIIRPSKSVSWLYLLVTFWRLLGSGGFLSMSRERLLFLASSCCLRSSRAAFHACCFCCMCCSNSGCSMLAAAPHTRLITLNYARAWGPGMSLMLGTSKDSAVFTSMYVL